ncbi:hypothetical protein ACHAW5_010309 [Stephanodiscus triporus]|uniref:PD-(D/E)XK endonuclease-like domain-containing protein n=1 Tax=Stephanodiscus triporus TaxID=2934178 RepID=A0ABD3Q7G5_9STRA
MPFLSRSMRLRHGGCRKKWQRSRSNDAAWTSFQTARFRCPRKVTPPIFHGSCPSQLTITRFFSSAEETARGSITTEKKDNLLDPYVILQNLTNQDVPEIPFPTYLSPTSLETFHKCPQAFFFLYILRLSPDPPMTPQLARGIICHTALEELYDMSPDDRSLTNLENLFRKEWNRLRGDRRENDVVATNDGQNNNYALQNTGTKKENEYDVLFREHGDDGRIAGYDIESEIDWGKYSLDLLKNYYDLEDPRTKSPVARELWVQARFASANSNDFIVRGKIDRIDCVDILPTTSDQIQLQIIDYKTGKKPWFKYSQKINDKITKEQFWKMKVYCLILWKMILQTDKASEQQQNEEYKYAMSWVLQQRLTDVMAIEQSNKPTWSNILNINSLRLIYLTSHVDEASAYGSRSAINGRSIGQAKYLDYSIDPFSFESILEQTELEVRTIANEIKTLVDKQSPHAFKHCNWKYCSCHDLRRKFEPGSVFQSVEYVE